MVHSRSGSRCLADVHGQCTQTSIARSVTILREKKARHWHRRALASASPQHCERRVEARVTTSPQVGWPQGDVHVHRYSATFESRAIMA